MSEPFQDPEPGVQPPEPAKSGYSGYGHQQQGYGYSYRPVTNYSGFWRRAGALLLDEIIIYVAAIVLAGLSGNYDVVGLVDLVLGIAYFSIFEGTTGQTVGGRAARVRVVDADTGAIIGIPRAILRNVVRIASRLVFGLGYFWMLWDRRKQTWHDKIASTVVVRTA